MILTAARLIINLKDILGWVIAAFCIGLCLGLVIGLAINPIDWWLARKNRNKNNRFS